MTKIKLTKEQFELLQTGTAVVLPNGDSYYYLPFWFKKCVGDLPEHPAFDYNTIFETYTFDNLPKELKDVIDAERSGL